MAESTSLHSLHCVVVTPERTVLDTDADFVALPLFDGEIGIAWNHSPTIGRLGYGELRVRSGSSTKRYYVGGGFVQVADNLVSVMTNRSIRAADIDAVEAAEQLASAVTQITSSEEEMAIRDRAIAQARAQLRISLREL